MLNKFITNYTKSIVLTRFDTTFKSGFCLSKQDFDTLKTEHSHFLHPKEITYFENLSHRRRQQSYLLGRYCAKKAIGAFLEQNDPCSICVENGVFLQPIVQHSYYCNVQTSISHTENIGAALAFPEGHPMGIDIETICTTKISTMKTQLTPNEKSMVNQQNMSEANLITLLWTVKEALSKALKCGLMLPFHLMEVETLEHKGLAIKSQFKNFHQFEALSFIFADTACSVVYPKKTIFELDILTIQQLLVNNSK